MCSYNLCDANVLFVVFLFVCLLGLLVVFVEGEELIFIDVELTGICKVKFYLEYSSTKQSNIR